MTEEEWLTSSDPKAMLSLVGGSKRKLRLFACACCRRAWNVFVPPSTIRIVMAAEAFADGEISAAGLARVHTVALQARSIAYRETAYLRSGYHANIEVAATHATAPVAETAALYAARSAALAAADTEIPRFVPNVPVREYMPPEYVEELVAQADLLRDIFGNPFQSLEIQLEWLTSDVLALAKGIYDDRAFDRMPILADALQDAGCDDDDILTHCRDAREHVRGCWVVDLLLGKG